MKEKRSLKGWDAWKFIKGRKKLIISIIGMLCVRLALDPDLSGLLAGGAVFEGLWAVAEYYFKKEE